MSGIRNRAKISMLHRRLGLFLSVPLLSWIVSAFSLYYYGLVMPNGLQGVYQLSPYNSIDVDLSKAKLAPEQLLAKLRTEYNLDKIYWLRLEAVGPHLWYIVKPSPFTTGMVFDANTGIRLDPLSDELLKTVANESLAGTKAVRLTPVRQYHRDYTDQALPAVKVVMQGKQPAELILCRATGRTLRRSDTRAQGFNTWYKIFHVFQWGGNMAIFTTFLYAVAAITVVLAILGLRLWFWRRNRPKTAYQKPGMKLRMWHRRLGLVVGTLILAQMVLGAYMWLSLGPLQDPFRGKNSFNLQWAGGISTSDNLADAGTVLEKIQLQAIVRYLHRLQESQ